MFTMPKMSGTALTAILTMPRIGKLPLHFLVTPEEGTLVIHCLDFGIMSSGATLDECKANMVEALEIYLTDMADEGILFRPAAQEYWEKFNRLRSSQPLSTSSTFAASLIQVEYAAA